MAAGVDILLEVEMKKDKCIFKNRFDSSLLTTVCTLQDDFEKALNHKCEGCKFCTTWEEVKGFARKKAGE